MKLSHAALTLVAIGVGFTAFTASEGCSSDDSTGTSGSVGKQPPAPDGPATTGTDERTFALNALFLGESDRSFNKNKDAWKDYGYNLDNLVTNVTKPDSPDLGSVCQRASGAPATVHQDGNQGIDNAFGKEILKLLDPFAPTPSKTITDAIVKGDFTIMLKVKGLTDDANQTNTGLSGTLLVGGAFSDDKTKTPTFSPADDWPYRPNPQVPITGAYINKGVFVNGAGGASVELALSIQGQTLKLTINKALITFKHNPPNDLVDGTIAGVIATDEFVNGISNVAGRFSTELCSGTTVEGIKDSIRQASDMLADGSQKAGTACTGISVGIGFTAKRVANPTKTIMEGAPPPNPCDAPADAGADTGGGNDAGGDAQ